MPIETRTFSNKKRYFLIRSEKANERCGRWYIPKDDIKESVYFKSTDGHTTQWDFSTRRLNLHILDLIQQQNGIVIVDSTRRGKRMPDALSKTVPIWCAVLNTVLFGMGDPMIYLPPHVVSASERSQIESRLPTFVEKFNEAGIDVDGLLKSKITKPLRPIWVTPDSFNTHTASEVSWNTLDKFHPIVLCTASIMAQDNTDYRPGYTYVQGAADDHEEWAAALSPDLLCDNIEILGDMMTSDEQLRLEITRLVEEKKKKTDLKDDSIMPYLSCISPSNYWIGKADDVFTVSNAIDQMEQNFKVLINLSEDYARFTDSTNSSKKLCVISQPFAEGKKGSKQLRVALPKIMEQISNVFDPNSQILILCDTGSDFSVGLSLTLLCLFPPPDLSKARDKVSIRQRLVMITSQKKVNPSRSTLNAINSFLMS